MAPTNMGGIAGCRRFGNTVGAGCPASFPEGQSSWPLLFGKQATTAGVSIADCLNGGVHPSTVTKRVRLRRLGLVLSEKQIPQVIEKIVSGDKREEALERVILRVKQAL
jgi:hypothetical protein